MDGHSPRTNTNWIDAPLSRDQRAVTRAGTDISSRTGPRRRPRKAWRRDC